MRGTLHKTESGWVVINIQATLNGPLLQSLPLIDNGHIDGLKLYDSNEGLEVEFEIVANEGEPLGTGEQPYKQYAKLVDKATRPLTEKDAWPEYIPYNSETRNWDKPVNFKPLTNKTNMEDITIKSVTNCPTCNSECKVNGGTTQYYVPVKKYTEEDMIDAIIYGSSLTTSNVKLYAHNYINSLNKQD